MRRPGSSPSALPRPAHRQAERDIRDELWRKAAPAGDQRRREPRHGADGVARPPRRLAHDACQPADPPQGRRPPHHPDRSHPALHRRRQLLRRQLLEGPPTRPLRVAPGRARRQARPDRPHQPKAQLLPARPRAHPPRQALPERPPLPGLRPGPIYRRGHARHLGRLVGHLPGRLRQAVGKRKRPARLLCLHDDRGPKGTALRVERARQQLRRLVRLPYRGQPGC